MNMKLNEDILWELIDGSLSAEEEEQVKKQLSSDADWKAKYDSMLELHSSLQTNIRNESPSIHFTDNVMDSVKNFKTAKARKMIPGQKINLKGLLLTIAGVIIGGLILSQGVLDFSLLDYSTLSADNLRTDYVDATPILDILGSSALVKSFLFIDAILAIFLVERFLFRPMTRRRYSY